MTDPTIGLLLANRYRIVDLIGKGAMGRVYRAQDVLLGDVPVAVKFLARTLLNDKMQNRFRTEARTCAQLGQKSLHIVRVMDYGVDAEEVPFYVMEYLHGESLSEIIRAQPLLLPRFLTLARHICLGLQCAHQEGVIHRDIKPGNMLVTRDVSIGEMVKILDFGIAQLLDSDGQETHSFMGTLVYASPEQMEGKELDHRSDIYSLGVMMFEMLTGKMPLQAETHNFAGWYKAHHFQTPRSFDSINLPAKLPKVLEHLIMSCLAKSPSDRPQSAHEVLQALEPLAERFAAGKQMGQKIEDALARLPIAPEPKTPQDSQQLSTDEICRFVSWPKDKPIAEIVFPQSVTLRGETQAALWVMMPKQEIHNRAMSTRYNRFLCMMMPHPMVLWVTVLHNRDQGPRWLPCFLDLKSAQGQEIARLLAKTKQYRLLFFSVENSQRCIHSLTASFSAAQANQLQEWADIGQTTKIVSPQPTISKNYLKQELEKIKPQILMNLESIHANPFGSQA